MTENKHAILVYNKTAGDRRHSRKAMAGLIAGAGYEVDVVSAKDPNLSGILGCADLIVAAGGDGTIGRTAVALSPASPPIAILPVGRSNNIARSLGLTAPLPQLVAGWARSRLRPFHLIRAEGPWGTRRLIEGFGSGAITEVIGDLDDDCSPIEARERIAEKVLGAPALRLDIDADGDRLSGDFVLCEITTIALVGPNLRLAHDADPADRLIEICILGSEAGERRAFVEWLMHAPAAEPAPLAVRAAGRVRIVGDLRRLRFDDSACAAATGAPVTAMLEAEPEPLRFLVPG